VKNSLSKLQKVVLRSLTLNGKQNIQAIQLKEKLNYATTHRSVKALEDLNLIWMSKRDETRGPKGAMEYSLTPYGIVESILRGDYEDQVDQVLTNWENISPKYIQHWNKFKNKEILKNIKQTLFKIYPGIVKPYRDPKSQEDFTRMEFSHRINIIQRNVLDTILIREIFNLYELKQIEIYDRFIEIVSEDPYYTTTWKRWYALQKMKNKHMEKLANLLEKTAPRTQLSIR